MQQRTMRFTLHTSYESLNVDKPWINLPVGPISLLWVGPRGWKWDRAKHCWTQIWGHAWTPLQIRFSSPFHYWRHLLWQVLLPMSLLVTELLCSDIQRPPPLLDSGGAANGLHMHYKPSLVPRAQFKQILNFT